MPPSLPEIRILSACPFGNARCNRADTDFRNQLHADSSCAVCVLQVVNELRQVFDRIDVVMRWRADESHAASRHARVGDDIVDLVTGQFAAFAGLGSLRDLDLNFIAVRQIPRSDAEATTGNLLDGRTTEVTVFVRRKAFVLSRRLRQCLTCLPDDSWRWREFRAIRR